MKTILVIEDEPAIRTNVVRILSHLGFQPVGAEDGAKGVQMAKAYLPDLIVCDILMPGLDGYEVLAALRQNPDTASIPFIFLSAKADRSDLRQGMNLGADDYITKPFTTQELVDAIQSRLQKQTTITQPYLDQMRQAAETLSRSAFYDILTALPNRIVLHHDLQAAIQTASEAHQAIAIFDLSLEQCQATSSTLDDKEIEDSVVQAVTERLQKCVGSNATIARLSDLEFGIWMTDVTDKDIATNLAEKMVEAISVPYLVQGDRVSFLPAIGISWYPEHGNSSNQLLARATQARRWCQQQAGSGYQVYSVSIEAAQVKRRSLEADLETALRKSEFELYYQPQVSLLTGRIVGMETLLRWQHPRKGAIAPAEIIQLAEEMGLMEQLGSWIMQTACAQGQSWRSHSPLPLQVSVNISPRQFHQKSFSETVHRILQQTKLNPRLLVLELSENCLIENPETTHTILQTLHDKGVNIHLGNFGTGFSSLRLLNQLPINCLKIDRTFISTLPNSPENTEVVKAILRIAQSFKFRVIAEGVETEEQLTFLQEHGCYGMQGNFYSPPLSVADFQKLLAEDKQLHRLS